MHNVSKQVRALFQLQDPLASSKTDKSLKKVKIQSSRHCKCIVLFGLLIFSFNNCCLAQKNVIIHFVHEANGKQLVSNDSVYKNSFSEPYRITKLRYYISNISWVKPVKTVSLVNAFAADSISIKVRPGKYNTLSFLIGVDSITNTRGAQSGSLDPLNDMYWTWNSGFVSWKIEGMSDSSKADLNRIEQHIGGYKSPYTTMRTIQLDLAKPLLIKSNALQHVYIVCNLDNYWKGNFNNSIGTYPVIVTAGPLASALADNFAAMFSIQKILPVQ